MFKSWSTYCGKAGLTLSSIPTDSQFITAVATSADMTTLTFNPTLVRHVKLGSHDSVKIKFDVSVAGTEGTKPS
jgi:hypothetical protein